MLRLIRHINIFMLYCALLTISYKKMLTLSQPSFTTTFDELADTAGIKRTREGFPIYDEENY